MADNNQLSKDELAALNKEANDGAEILVETEEDQGVESIDLTKDQATNIAMFPGLSSLNELFALELSVKLSKYLRKNVEAQALKAKINSYGNYSETLGFDLSICAISLQELSSAILITIDRKLLAAVLDILFGGEMSEHEIDPAHYSKMESYFSCKIIELILQAKSDIWSNICPFSGTILTNTNNPKKVGTMASEENVIIVDYVVHIGDFQGNVQVVMQHTMLEPLKSAIQNNGSDVFDTEDNRIWKESLFSQVLETPLSFETRFPERTISLGEMMNLKVDDIIPIDHPEFVNISIENNTLYSAKCGVINGKQVVEIDQQFND